MKFAYAFTEKKNLHKLEQKKGKIEVFVKELVDKVEKLTSYKVRPIEYFVLHDFASATKVHSHYPVPAWTTPERGVINFCPEEKRWQNIMKTNVKQLNLPESAERNLLKHYDQWNLDFLLDDVVGHELCHLLEIFENLPDGMDWFEEGLCFYLPRRILSETKKELVKEIYQQEMKLVSYSQRWVKGHFLKDFSAYRTKLHNNLIIFLNDYHLAANATKELVDEIVGGDVREVMQAAEQVSSEIEEPPEQVMKTFIKKLFERFNLDQEKFGSFVRKFRIF